MEDVDHGVAGVAVVGAGYAGMAAAVTLAGRGVRVTVLESGPVPGGRARRVFTHGRTLDNGQHIFVGAYSELFRLMGVVGVPADAVLRMPLEIRYANGFELRAWSSSRWGLAAGLLAARGVPLSERMGAVRFLRAMRAVHFRLEKDVAVSALLARHSQDGRIGRYLWAPLCVSALNTPLTQASANVFLAALRDTLAGPPEASDLLLPRVDLSRLFPEPAAEFVRARDGEVRFGTTVRELSSLRSEFGKVIVAVGPHQLRTLLPESPEFDYQPIYTCYLQYPEDTRLAFPMLGLADGLVQWVFDRGALLGEKGRLACVISAQGDHQQMSQEELAETCQHELRRAFPQLPAARWAQVIAEKRATIACTPGLKRPPQLTARTGVVLAGDYTDPEYPPTLEAAVRSGIRAADLVMSSG